MAYEASPGELYRGITAVGENFEGGETKSVIEREPDFVIFCKRMNKQFPGLGKGSVYTQKQKEAIDFLGWHLKAEEHMGAVKATFVVGLIPALILITAFFFIGFGFALGEDTFIGLNMLSDMEETMKSVILFAVPLFLFAIIGAAVYFVYSYPNGVAEEERTRALTYVPEMVGYLIMSMKLVPNLEKAIEFSAKHGKGKVADDFKRLIWDFQIGVYSSISEGLDMMALNWGKYSTELKESLMKIRASVMEPNESHRYAVLDKTMLEVLESVKDKMGDYARSLNQPSVMLFYIGVLLPLLLVIILPVGSAFSSMPFSTPPVLIFVYCIMIPAIAFSFARNVIKKRPPTYDPPIIDDNFVGLPKKWHMKFGTGTIDTRLVFAIVLLVGISVSFFLSVEGLPPKDMFPRDEEGNVIMEDLFQIVPADRQLSDVFKENGVDYYEKINFDLYFIQISIPELGGGVRNGTYYKSLLAQGIEPDVAENIAFKAKIDLTSKPSNDPTKYIFWAGAILSLAIACCILLYYKNIYKREAQLQIMQMEDEFKESMYMIASRMGENKPVESALKQARDFLPNLLISKRIFGKTVENIELMGLPLETAVFDPIYGSMRGIPSKALTTAMRLLVDSVNLGVEVAARTLMSLSLQMENMDKVNKSLKDMVSDVTTTMQTMALFIAPMVLGITTALQKVVVMTLAQVVAAPETGTLTESGQAAVQEVGGSGGMGSGLFNISIETFKTFASPLDYLLIIGIYVAMIIIILTYFTTKIKEDNELLFRINLAKSLPIGLAVYLITTIAANLAISAIM
jgi:hypothetical protein